MSFQDLQRGEKPPPRSSSSSPSNNSSQAVAAGIFQINTSLAAFRRHVDAVGTSKDTPDHRRKLHDTGRRILQLVKETSEKLKSISESDRDASVHASKKIEHAKLARDFQAVVQEFQKVQQLASERESSYSPLLPTSSSQTTNSDSADQTDNQESQPFLTEKKGQEILMLNNEISFNEAMIDEKQDGLRDIQFEVGQANEIFKDLAVLVHGQGIVIDDIQSNVDTSSSAAADARVQLRRGSRSVKSKSSWCWWVLVLVVLVLVILLFILII